VPVHASGQNKRDPAKETKAIIAITENCYKASRDAYMAFTSLDAASLCCIRLLLIVCQPQGVSPATDAAF
jgi:hypothetical protein